MHSGSTVQHTTPSITNVHVHKKFTVQLQCHACCGTNTHTSSPSKLKMHMHLFTANALQSHACTWTTECTMHTHDAAAATHQTSRSHTHMFMLVTIPAGKCQVTGCFRHPPCHTCSTCCKQLVQVHPSLKACWPSSRLASTCVTNAAAHTTLLCLCWHPLCANAH